MTAKQNISENQFETEIVDYLLEKGGYREGDNRKYDKETALEPETFLEFIKDTQPDEWRKLKTIHGKDTETKLVKRLAAELENRGTIEVLRDGITDYGVHFKTAVFQPVSGLNPQHRERYDKNILTVTRQLYYSTKNNNSLDLMLSLNGLPVATAEIKNSFTGQTVHDAMEQYRLKRNSSEPLFRFNKRALVHFAVDPDEVHMTTRLNRKKTEFLPFNKGRGRGPGNPDNPKGCRTAYLWETVWTKDAWMDILCNFITLQKEKKIKNGRPVRTETLIFPRYHQWDAVLKLKADALAKGPGHNYLVQHSAGSGKSNTIAWLAYRLARLHDKTDRRVYDTVVVMTDRKVLDRQLQNTLKQFDCTPGELQVIDEDSNQLAAALKRGANIIVTTQQKFPFVLDKIGTLPQRNYAVIVDEAHSSQSGESAHAVKQTLTEYRVADHVRSPRPKGGDDNPENEGNPGNGMDNETDGERDNEDKIREEMLIRGHQENLSFFAFTATPKNRTLEAFGRKVPKADGGTRFVPFHLYSMEQAIREKFIMDVLQNYTTYKTYYKISKAVAADPRLDKKKAASAIARFVSLHPHNIAQKTEVMVEHFRQHVTHQIQGRAKAMVVTSSRPQVIRYKKEIDRYIKEKNYNIKTLVAFTPFMDSDGVSYNEAQFNGFGETALPKKFESDQYRILLVADKYQTGFDQPLLHTMYVDKKLSGVKAVQTLSRLNRIYPGKESTIVLDFANEEETIDESFKDYYGETRLEEATDPNKLYDFKSRMEQYGVTRQEEVENFYELFIKTPQTMPRNVLSRLEALISPAVSRYEGLEEEEQDDYKKFLTKFIRLYGFLSQVMPFQDENLERLYTYGRYLERKLITHPCDTRLVLDDEVELEYYRLQKISENSIQLPSGENGTLEPLTHTGAKTDEESLEPLSEIIRRLNERFGTDFMEDERVEFEKIIDFLGLDDSLGQQARNNKEDLFKPGVRNRFLSAVIEVHKQFEDGKKRKTDLFKRIMDDAAFREEMIDGISSILYQRFNSQP